VRSNRLPAPAALLLPGLLVGLLAVAGCSDDDNDGDAGAVAATAPTGTTTTVGAPSTGAASPATTTTVAPDPLEPVVLPCEQTIGTEDAPPDDCEAVLDAVALPTADRAPDALQTSATGEADPDARLFAKTGLLVRGGATFEILVPEDEPAGFSIGWGSPAVRTRTLAGNCPGDGWLAFAGGFWVAEVGCRPLVVRSEGQEATVEIGVGAPCAGQAPPPEPSDT
jgi:hypothetical protein